MLKAPLEVNIFHTSKGREATIQEYLLNRGAVQVLIPSPDTELSFIDSNRKYVHPDGIYRADVVFVPLEDGDRCEALRKMGKDVISVDLNPMSRTANRSSATIVDNVVRALPLLIRKICELANASPIALHRIVSKYSNEKVLETALQWIRRA